MRWSQACYGRLQVALPEVPGAEMVNDDELCATCHETYVKSFATNEHGKHQGGSCESCHGPASKHLETRGKEPGLIRSFKTMNSCEKSEVCLSCHEKDACSVGGKWRTSTHAHKGVSCVDCHRAHYNVPVGTPATTEPGDTARNTWDNDPMALIRGQDAPAVDLSFDVPSNKLGAIAPGICYKCHCDKAELPARRPPAPDLRPQRLQLHHLP